MDIVQKLWEIEQIKKAKARYFRLIDTKDEEGYLSVFTDDLQFIAYNRDGSVAFDFGSKQEFKEYLAGRSEAREAGQTVHAGYLPEIEIIDERNATGIWAMSDVVNLPYMAFRGFGHYYEEYVKEDDGNWRIRRITLRRLWMEDAEAPE